MVIHVSIAGTLVAGLTLLAADAPPPITQDDLNAAPDAEVEKLGVVQCMGRIGGTALAKATAERPPRVLVSFWSMADRSFFATFVVDLSNEKIRKVTEPGFDKDAPRWPSAIGRDGKHFLSCMRGGLAVYDPVDDSIKMVRPIPKASWLRGIAVGADGGVYVSDYPTGCAARYDPVTGESECYGPQGGPFKITRIYGYSVGSDGEWVYTAAGKIPWYVAAHNRKTGEQKNLFQFNQTDFPDVTTRGSEVYLRVHIVDPQTKKSRSESYRLAGGEAAPVEKIPAHKPVPGPWDGMPQPKIDLGRGRGLPMREGGAVMRYRMPGEDEKWRELALPIPGEPYRVRCIAPSPDGRLVVATGIYGDVYHFDPATGKFERIGNPANRNVYCLLPLEDRIYFGGYPNAMLGVFENGDGKMLYDWNRLLGSKRTPSIALGADGRIYLGCQAEREFVGGALAWWDPKTKEPGGIRFPNDECWRIISALDGRLIVIASRAVVDPMHPEVKATDGQIIVYDTKQQKLVQRFAPLPGEKARGSAGMIAECAPGIVLGLATFRGRPTLYVVDALKGEVLHRAELPAKPQEDVTRGPDGMLYTFLGKTLVRIHPKTYAITPVGKAAPGQMAFIGRDLYLAEDFELRRIGEVALPCLRR